MNLTYEEFNLACAEDQKKYIFRGFLLIKELTSYKLLTKFNLFSNRYYEDVSFKEFKDDILAKNKKQLVEENDLEYFVMKKIRKEQGFLRKQLFNHNDTYKCAICGKEYPVEFLWCSHIKKREKCTPEEKLDYKNIVVPMCKFGCDDLYEKGYIGVYNGKIIQLKKINNSNINNYLKNIINKNCLFYNSTNKKYFDEHLKINTEP